MLCGVKKTFLMDKMLDQELNLYKSYPGKKKHGYRPASDRDVLYFVFSVTKKTIREVCENI